MQNQLVVFGSLFFLSILYAVGLNWMERHLAELFDDHTWITVVIGVGYTIIGLAILLEKETIWLIFFAFVSSGLPIVARSLINEIRRKKTFNHILQEEENDESI